MKISKTNLVLVSLATGLVGAAAHADGCPAINVPSSFSANEKLLTIGTDLNLKSGGQSFGKIVERTLHFTPTFEIQNDAGETVATAHQKLFSWGTQIDVADCSGQIIGTVKEEILKSFFHTYTSYKILDARGNQIAASQKLELLATNFSLQSGNGTQVGSMHRPWLNILTDHWDVTYNPGSGVDPRLWLTIPAYKTAADNLRRKQDADKRSQEEDKKRREDEDRARREDSDKDSHQSMNESTQDGDASGPKAVATEDEAPASTNAGPTARSI